jgi:hypothetical protein
VKVLILVNNKELKQTKAIMHMKVKINTDLMALMNNSLIKALVPLKFYHFKSIAYL